MIKIRFAVLSKWINLAVGVIAILYTAFSYFDSKINVHINNLSSPEKNDWVPDAGYQLLAFILCCFLVFSEWLVLHGIARHKKAA